MQCLKPPFWLLAAVGLLWGAAGRAADYPDFVTLVERYSPAVVSIQTKSEPKEQSKRGHPTQGTIEARASRHSRK